MYKATTSFTMNKEDYEDIDIKKGEILAENFVSQEIIEELLEAGYIVKYDGSGGTEVDPIFSSSPAFSISNEDIENWNNSTGGSIETITEDTKIYELDSGIYNVNGNVKLFYNDNENKYIKDIINYSLFVGKKTTSPDIRVPYLVYIGYKDSSSGVSTSGFQTGIYSGLSMEGTNGTMKFRAMNKEPVYTSEDQTIEGVKTFQYLPKASNNTPPSSSTNFTTKGYVDSAIANAIGNALGGSY